MKKENLIGAGIALLSLILLTFLPLVEAMGQGCSLFDLFSVGGAFAALGFIWLFFPLLAVVTHLFGKVRVLTACLMLIPVAWGLAYVAQGCAGIGYWLYSVITLALVVYSIILKKKMKKQNN